MRAARLRRQPARVPRSSARRRRSATPGPPGARPRCRRTPATGRITWMRGARLGGAARPSFAMLWRSRATNMPSEIITTLTGCLERRQVPRAGLRATCSVARARALASSSSCARVDSRPASAHASSAGAGHADALALDGRSASVAGIVVLERPGLADVDLCVMPTRDAGRAGDAHAAPSVTRLRSAVNSTPPTPVGRRARPTMSPGASRVEQRSARCAGRLRFAPTRRLLFVHHEEQQASGRRGFVRRVARLARRRRRGVGRRPSK